MANKLEKAVEIYRSLGYEETDFEHILDLEIGSKEERQIAREGLKSGDWSVIRQIGDNSYGFVPVVDVDLSKLAIYAIRVGVDAKRAASILRKNGETGLKAIAARGNKYAVSFIKAACVSGRRPWEHSSSVFGMLAVNLVHRLNLNIPNSSEYIKDWAAQVGQALGIVKKDRNYDEHFAPTAEEIKKRFHEHIEVGISENTPATGPFSEVFLWGVQNGVLSKDKASDQIFYALNSAQRPGDRKAWMNVLRQIGLTDEYIEARGESLIPLLALGETPLLERFAPVLIACAPEHLLYSVLISCTAAKAKKIRKMVLNSALKRECPKSAEEYADWLLLYKNDEDKDISGLADRLARAWNIELKNEAAAEKKILGLWKKTPPLWKVPRFELGEISPENLTELAAEVSGRKACVGDIVFERFLAMANQIAYKNPEEAKMSLAGIPSNDMSGVHMLGAWAKNKENRPSLDIERKICRDGKEVLQTDFSELFYARRTVICMSIDKWPCILSTPSFEDLSICLQDLLNRLSIYKRENFTFVSEPDLQLALTRLDVDSAAAPDSQTLREIDLKIQLPSGEFVQDETGNDISVGKIIADYLKDPYIEPEFKPGESRYWWIDLDLPKSLKSLPNRFSYDRDTMFSMFPLWGDYALTAVRRDSEVYHGQGAVLRQVARRRRPLTKGAMMNWLSVQSCLSDECAEDVIKAAHEAWERGLLLPGNADVLCLDWRGKDISNLASLAHSMDCIAKDGMLSLVWEAACDTVAASLNAPRMLSGTAEIVQLLLNYLDEVIFAVQKQIAPKSILKLEAIRRLADKSGASKAADFAKQILEKLKRLDAEVLKEDVKILNQTDNALDIPLPRQAFDEVWKTLPAAKPLIHDNASIHVEAVEIRKNEKIFMFSLKLSDIPKYEYRVRMGSWIYGLANEGQVQAYEACQSNEVASEKSVWLHFDNTKGKIVVSNFRNWRDETDGPLRGNPTPYSRSFLTIAVALLAQDGESICSVQRFVSDLVESGDLSVDILRGIMKELLLHEDISPAKLVRVLEKETSLLSVFWVMLTECIKTAGAKTETNKKPPLWSNRILDVCIYHAYYLKEAIRRGLITDEVAILQGLTDIAHCTAKSAAIKKARTLAKFFNIKQ